MRLVFLILFVSLFLSGCLTNIYNNPPRETNYEKLVKLADKKQKQKESEEENLRKQKEDALVKQRTLELENELKQKKIKLKKLKKLPNLQADKPPLIMDASGQIINIITREDEERLRKKREAVRGSREYNRKKEAEEKANKIIAKEKETFENAKLECEAIGYKKGTEKFGECVLDLTE